MELRRYWNIIKRRWLLVLIPVCCCIGSRIGNLPLTGALPSIPVCVLLLASRRLRAELKDEQRYYNWLTSEYIVNGLTDWVRGGEFSAAVSEHLAEQGHEIPAHAVQAGLVADNARSMLTISLTSW